MMNSNSADSISFTRIELSRRALLNNFDLFKEVSDLEVMPVLKGNAYGHGAEQIARILEDRRFPYLVVNGYHEYLTIRKVSDRPVLVMGAIPIGAANVIDNENIAYLVQSLDFVQALGATKKPFTIHVDVDTGMSRYGVPDDKLDELLAEIKKHPLIKLEGVASHLADADNPDNAFTEKQGHRFDQAVERVRAAGFSPTVIHLSNSPGSTKRASRHATAMRAGFGLYGTSPLVSSDPLAKKLKPLQPVLRLVTKLTVARRLKPGDTVSYSRTFLVENSMRVGTIPVGYHEAIDRELSSKGILTSGPHQLPILGRVCMNHTILDLGDADIDVGDEIVVISNVVGDPNTVRGHCDRGAIFDYEFITNINPELPRVLID